MSINISSSTNISMAITMNSNNKSNNKNNDNNSTTCSCLGPSLTEACKVSRDRMPGAKKRPAAACMEPPPESLASEAPCSSLPGESSRKSAGGTVLAAIAQLPEGAPLGRNMAQAVADRLKQLAKNGNEEPLRQYKALKSHSEKRNFSLRLSIDPEASFVTVTETRKIEHMQKEKSVSG